MLSKTFKIFAVIMITVLSLTGCMDDGENIGSSITNGGETVFEITMPNGEDEEITVDELRYYIYHTAGTAVYAKDPSFDGNFSAVNWDEKTEGDKSLADVILEKAKNDIIQATALIEAAERNGVGLSDDEKNQSEDLIRQYKTESGEERLMLVIKAMGVTSIDGYEDVFEHMTAYTKADDDFRNNRDKYITKDIEEKLKANRSEDVVSAQHILIMNDSEKFDDPKTTIEDVRMRALAGEDFNTLMTEFNEDTGEAAGGYTFGKGEMVPEFEAAAFALDYDQISEVVQSDYGYHVIKRIIGFAEYTQYLMDNVTVKEVKSVLDTISVRDIMNDTYNATQKITAMQGGK